jgi:Ser-tRNA(Ala) deacylase AlaX
MPRRTNVVARKVYSDENYSQKIDAEVFRCNSQEVELSDTVLES